LNVFGIVVSAATGAIVGDNVGYWIGRRFGYGLLLRYGPGVGLSESRIKLGQYLFLRRGRTIVFFCRFIGILGALVSFLAGVNRMHWRKFLVANAAGSIVWAAGFGLGAYLFGKALLQLTGSLVTGFLIVGAILLVATGLFIRAHEAELQTQAERALPGPLRRVRRTEEKPHF
jgi:membrane protein DedA with SNARE-associated domain